MYLRKTIITVAVFAVFGALALASNSESGKSSSDDSRGSSRASSAEGNRIIKECSDGESTYSKDKCREKNKGGVFDFVGEVADIKDAHTLHIKLDSGNYADVKFASNKGDTVSVGQTISFKGKLTFIGSGIMFSHEIESGE